MCPTLLAAPSTLRPTFFSSLCRGILHFNCNEDCTGVLSWKTFRLLARCASHRRFSAISTRSWFSTTAIPQLICHSSLLSCNKKYRRKHQNCESWVGWAESFQHTRSYMFTSFWGFPYRHSEPTWSMGRTKRVSDEWNNCKKWTRTSSLYELWLQAAISVQ